MTDQPDRPALTVVPDGPAAGYAHNVVPMPSFTAGARAWATYHWARAWGFSQTMDDLMLVADSRALANAATALVAEVRVAYLLDKLADVDSSESVTWGADAAEGVARLTNTPEAIDTHILDRLRALGVDPATIQAFRLPPTDGRPQSRPEFDGWTSP